MTRRHDGVLQYGDLIDAARDIPDIEPTDYPPEQFEDLREALSDHISVCRWCDAEFVNGWSDKFCTDQCEVDYRREYYDD